MNPRRFIWLCILVLIPVLSVVGLSLRSASPQAATLPESAEAQAIIYKAQEILYTHPERAEECARLLNGVLEKYPGTRQASLALAHLSYMNHATLKNMTEAEQFQERLEKEFPNSLALGELLVRRGKAYEKAGDIQKAKQAYERSFEILDKFLPRYDATLLRRDATRQLAFLLEEQLGDPAAGVKVLLDADKVFAGTITQQSVWDYIAWIAIRHGGVSGVPSLQDLSSGNLPDRDADARAAAMLGAVHWQLLRRDYRKAADILSSLEANYSGTSHQVGVVLFKAQVLKFLEPENVQGRLALWEQAIKQWPNDPRIAEA